MARVPSLSIQNIHLDDEDDDDDAAFSSPLGVGDDDLAGDLAELEQLRKSVQNNLRLRPLGSAASGKSPSRENFPSDGPRPISPSNLAKRLGSALKRPLILDTRPLHIHLRSYIFFSVNLAIPSLILKRCKKPGGNFTSLETIRQFITTDEGRGIWEDLFGEDDGDSSAGMWDGDIIIYDHSMDPKDASSSTSMPWVLLGALEPLVSTSRGSLGYLEGGFSHALTDPDMDQYIIGIRSDGESDENGLRPGGGVFQLDTNQPFHPKGAPVEIYTGSTNSSKSSALASSKPSSLLSSKPNLRSSALSSNIPSSLHSVKSLNSIHSLPSGAKSSLLPLALKLPESFDVSENRENTLAPHRPGPLRRPSAPNLGASVSKKPGLGKLNTKSTERLNLNLPKLQVKPIPMQNTNLQLTFSPTTPSDGSPSSPSRSKVWDKTQPEDSNTKIAPSGAKLQDGMTPYYTPPHSPSTPRVPLTGVYSAHPDEWPSPQYDRREGLPPSPSTARPESLMFAAPPPPPPGGSFPPGKTFGFGSQATPASAESPPSWSVSTILPSFLFLGPEPNSHEHVEELVGLGVKRIINIAAECDPDDHGLNLDGKRDPVNVPFEKYTKIAMRDTVEEDGMRRGIGEVCELLDDARLHSAPTYIHCRAGKSRSVTAVIAYLIHANHWTLSRSYQFVVERRKGVSPNIGFVSELMSWEEEELGGKSGGVVGGTTAGNASHGRRRGGGNSKGSKSAKVNGSHGHPHEESSDDEDNNLAGKPKNNRLALRNTHIRESLPPTFQSTLSSNAIMLAGENDGSASAVLPGPAMDLRSLGDSNQEIEIKDASGRYRHARRAPVDENTLQPMRRVSKAGLESSAWNPLTMED